MRSKKTAALVLSSAMLFTAMLGLAGCRDKDDTVHTGPKDPAEQGVTLRADERVKAYVAYRPDGTEIGKYTTLAAAINAAVDEDAEEEVFGSYVTKADGTRHLFTNRAGFTSENSDMFWYYEDGTKLDQMFCWDSVNSIQMLQNTNYIVHEVSSFGKKSMQTWNSYGLLDLNGNRIDKEKQSAQSYELSSSMDAAMLSFPKRLNGITKQVYNIDLTNVKITPPYQGGDPVYAFMGFYSWQDYYVVDLGIACDVTTGNWYPFEASSRDDSFSDADYEIDMEGCLMTSTWDKAGGYFVPDMASISMSIETQLLADPDYPDDIYQSNYLVVKDKDGKVMYQRRLEADTLSNFFPSANMGKENTYIFTAGLDIKNANALSDGVHVKNVDYFNGAKFENLTITEATAYFPTVEEMSDVQYGGGGINPDLRGNTYSILLADNMKDTPETGVFDYVILNNNLCTSYEAKDGCDVYSFSFDHVPVADEEFGTNLKGYQDQIDALKGISAGGIVDKIADIEAVRDNIYLKEKDLQKFYGLLDFTPFEEANALLLEAMRLTDAGKAVAEDFKKLGDILSYDIKGVATDGEEIAGYLYNEIEKFKTIKAAYEGLGAEDKERIFFHIERAKFEKWNTLATELPAAIAQAEAVTAKIKLGAKNTTAVSAWTEQTAKYALDELVYWSIAMKYGRAWGEGENDDPNSAKVAVMNFDNNTYPSIRIILCREFLEENGVELPSYLEEMFEAIAYDDFYEGAYYPIYGTVKVAIAIEENTWANNQEIEDFLNDVWAQDYELSGQIAWNWNSGAKFETYYSARTKYIADVAGGNGLKTYQYFDAVAALLSENLNYKIKGNGWGIDEEGPISLKSEETANGKAAAALVNALTKLDSAYEVKGWTAPDDAESVAGYYYSDILAYRAAKAAFDVLQPAEKVYVASVMTDAKSWTAWSKESDALAAIVANAKYTDAKSIIKLADTPMGATYTDRTPEYALQQLTYWANRIARGTAYGEGENDDGNSVASKICNFDNSVYPSIRVALTANFLQNELGLTLTPYMQSMLKAIKVQEFYDDYYYVIANVASLAKSIVDGNKTKIADLEAEEREILSKYFVISYQGPMKAKFASMNQWQSGRAINGIIKYEGKEIAGKTDLKGYFDVVNDFLKNIGYTIDDNWGVTVPVIITANLSEEELAVANLIVANSDISGNTPDIKGWLAPEDAVVISGYLGSELANYRTYKTELAKLTEEQQANVTGQFSESMLAAWEKFDTEMTALQKDDALKNLTIKAVKVSGAMQTFTGEEAMAELLAVLTTISRGELYVTNDDANGGKVATMTSDNQWMPSFFACFLVEKFTEADVKLPTVIDDLLVQVNYKDASGTLSAFAKDVKYIYNVMNLSAKIKAGTATKQEIVSVVNGYMKGFTKFTEGGIAWNFTNGDDGLPLKEFTYRSKVYKAYFGFANNAVAGNTFGDHINSILSLLKNVEFTKYGDTETVVGVAADIKVDNVKDVISVLPETVDGWNKESDAVTVTVTDGVSKVDGSAIADWTFTANIAVNKKIDVENGAIKYDVGVTGGDCTIVIYVAPRGGDVNGGKGHYVYFTDFNGLEPNKLTTGSGVITAKQILDKLVEKRGSWGYTAESVADMTELDIVELRVYTNAGAVLTINTLELMETVENA